MCNSITKHQKQCTNAVKYQLKKTFKNLYTTSKKWFTVCIKWKAKLFQLAAGDWSVVRINSTKKDLIFPQSRTWKVNRFCCEGCVGGEETGKTFCSIYLWCTRILSLKLLNLKKQSSKTPINLLFPRIWSSEIIETFSKNLRGC